MTGPDGFDTTPLGADLFSNDLLESYSSEVLGLKDLMEARSSGSSGLHPDSLDSALTPTPFNPEIGVIPSSHYVHYSPSRGVLGQYSAASYRHSQGSQANPSSGDFEASSPTSHPKPKHSGKRYNSSSHHKSSSRGSSSSFDDDYSASPLIPTDHDCFAVRAEGQVTINGKSDFDGDPLNLEDDALIYAGDGISINGRNELPIQRDEFGNPILDEFHRPVLVENAITLGPDFTELKIKDNSYSGLSQSVVEQDVQVPEFAALRDEKLAEIIPSGTEAIEVNLNKQKLKSQADWDSLFPSGASAEQPAVYRVTSGDLDIPKDITVENSVFFLEQGDVKVTEKNTHLNNVTLVTHRGEVELKDVETTNLTVLSAGEIEMDKGARYGGETFLASGPGEDIEFRGATKTLDPEHSLTVISQGEIQFKGYSDTRGYFISKGDFTFNGKSTLVGSIESEGDVRFNGYSTVIGAPKCDDGLRLIENSDFSVVAQEAIAVTDTTSELSFNFEEIFDTTDPDFINDAFEVALLDANGRSLVHTISPNRDVFFNLTEGIEPDLATGVSLTDNIVTLNLSNVAVGTEAILEFRLVNNDSDTTTQVTIRDIELIEGDRGDAISSAPEGELVISPREIDFSALEDVSSSINASYGQTSFSRDSDRLYVDLAASNVGGYDVQNTLLVAVEDISDLSVQVQGFDGLTPDGTPYFDLSDLIDDGILSPDEITETRTIEFLNPDGNQFTYELVFLSELNRVPNFVTDPQTEALLGQVYTYDSDAIDPDNDALTYTLLTGPGELSLESATGLITGTFDAVGTHSVTVQVDDGRGGVDTQTYTIEVVGDIPNRPPVITTTPVTEANISILDAGKVIVSHDEWTLSNTGFSNAPQDAKKFVQNLANYFTDGTPGNFLGFSSNFGIAGSSLAAAFDEAGHNWTVTTSIDFTVDNLKQFDGIFLGGFPADNQVLIDYVNQGGNVYLTAGTASFGGASNEAQAWSTFLEAFGLQYDGSRFNGVSGTLPIDATPHPIFEGIDRLFQNNGNSVIDLNPRDSQGFIVAGNTDGAGLYAIYDGEFAAGENYQYDVDAIDPDFDPIEYELDDAPEGMWIDPVSGVIRWAPTLDQLGLHAVTVAASDGRGGQVTQSYEVLVDTDIDNRTPFITSKPILAAFANQVYQYDVIALDPENDVLNYSLISAPAAMSIDSANGTLLWVPESDNTGEHPVLIQVDDGRGGITQQEFVIEVLPSGTSVIEGFKFNDANGDGLWDQSLETGLENITIYLDLNNNGLLEADEPRQLTQADNPDTPDVNEAGYYRFEGLQEGIYWVQESVPIGYNQTFPEKRLVLGNNLLNNGDFEIGPAPITSWVPVRNGSVELENWTILGSSIDHTCVGLWQPSEGNCSIDLDGTPGPGGIAQTIETVPGQEYVVTFDLSAHGFLAAGTLRPMTVQAAGQSAEFIGIATGNVRNMNYQPQQWQFTANSTSTTIEFLSFVGDSLGAVLDNVKVSPILASDSRSQRVELAANQIIRDVNFGNEPIIIPSNLSPEIISEPVSQAIVGNEYRYEVNAIDENGDELTYELLLAPEGMIVDPNTGIVLWIPQVNQLNENNSIYLDSGTYNILLKADDNQGGIDIQSFELNLGLTNFKPIISSTAAKFAGINLPYQYKVQAQDADGTIASYRLDNAPAGMTIDPVTGVLNWTPTAEQIGTKTVDLTVIDDRGGEATQSFNIEVLETLPNDVPEILSTPRTVTQLQGLYTYQLIAEDPNGDPLSYGIVNGPEGMTINDEGLVTWQPNQLGNTDITLQVDDGRGGVLQQTFSLNVVSQSSNQLPEITSAPESFNATVGQTYEYDATAIDPDGDIVFWSLDKAPAGVSIDPERGTLRWTPRADQIGTFEVAVLATDSNGGIAGQAFNLTVRGANLAPQISSTPPTTGAVDRPYNYAVLAQDPEGDAVTYSLGNAPDGMTIDAQTGLISWTPTAAQLGSQAISVVVTDSLGATAEQTFSIVVSETAANQAPAITSQPTFAATPGEVYSYTVTGIDPDGDALTYQLLEGPEGMAIDPVTGELSWTPSAAGTFTVAVGAIDPAGLGGAQQFTLTVADNSAPVIISVPVETAAAGQLYRYDVRAQDPDGETVSYELRNAPDGMTIDNLGRIRWTPDASNAGAIAVEVVARDHRGAESVQSFNLTVAVDDVAPIARVVPSIQPVGLGESVTLFVSASDNVGVEQLSLTVNGEAVPLTANGLYTFTPETVGEINAVVTATDAAGNSTQAESTFSVLDFTDASAPVIELPDLGDQVFTGPTEIIGTVSDDNLQSYTLSVAPLGTENFTEIFSGTESVTNGVLGTFDPTLLQNDSYTLRLTAEDFGGNIVSLDETVSVAGELKLGNFQLSFTDLEIPVNGIPISVIRTYDTLTSNTQDDFGFGWRLEFRDTNLRTNLRQDEAFDLFGLRRVGFDNRTRIYVTLPDGARQAFTFDPTINRLSGFLAGAAAGAGIDADTNLYNPAFEADDGVTSTLSVRNPESSGNMLSRGEDGTFRNLAGQPYNPADPYFGGIYVLTTKEGIEYEIDGQTGDLLKVTDTNGNTLTYTEAGIFSNNGVEITFERDAQNRITAIVDSAGDRISYEYDSNGDLSAVTDRENATTRFDYSETLDHYLDEVIDPLGRSGIRSDYDEDGRLQTLFDGSGDAFAIDYDPNNATQTVTDANGNSTFYEYDSRGNVVQEVNALGGVTLREFDSDSNLLSQTNAEGETTTYTYDSNRNKLTETDDLGNTSIFTHDRFGNALSITDALGNTTNIVNDSRGNQISIGTGTRLLRRSVNRAGNITEIVGVDGATTSFVYDSRGQVIERVDALGQKTQYSYNEKGNPLTQTTFVTVDGIQQESTTRWNYDREGRVTSITNAAGQTTQYQFDLLGNLIQSTDPLGHSTQYRYDDSNRLIETIFTDGLSETITYDSLGREIARTDRLGQTTQFVYNALGQLIETVISDDTPGDLTDNPRRRTKYDGVGRRIAEIDARGNRTEFEYDDAGRLVLIRDALGNETLNTVNEIEVLTAQTDALGRTTNYFFDELGRQIQTQFADGSSISYTYNEAGLRDSVTDQAGRTTYTVWDELGRAVQTILPDATPEDLTDNPIIRREYDELNRVVAEIDESGLRTEYSYDIVGQLLTISDGRGTTSYTYDENGNQISATNPLGQTTQFAYDSLNRLVETTYADGTRSQVTYDAIGRVIAETDQAGTIKRYEYDSQNNLITVIDALDQRTEYEYDVANNLIGITDANNNLVSHGYDALNRRVSSTLPLGQSSTTVYDAVGNPVNRTNFNGNTISYEYDQLNRLTAKRFQDSNEDTVYTYTPTGETATITDQRGQTQYAYDARDRLLKKTETDGQSISYVYDIAGNLTSLTTPNNTTTYTYDSFHRLSQVSDASGNITNYGYDSGNNLVRKELPNGVVETRTYNLLNQLIRLEQNQDGAVIASYEYTLDSVGNRTSIEETDGRQIIYTYDDLYRVLTESVNDSSNASTITYTYDPVGNRLSLEHSADGLTTYTYDENDRLLIKNQGEENTQYTYDDNGNLLFVVSPIQSNTYTWNDEDELIQFESSSPSGDQQITYEYDANGIRVSKTVDGTETRYLVDDNRLYASVVEEQTSTGEVAATYVHGERNYSQGHDLISQNRSDEISFYHTDGLGSTRVLTDINGTVTDKYIYDAYGELISSEGDTVNNFLFAGEQFDTSSDNYYLRARYYNPDSGRFIARDPFEGVLTDPLSLSKYTYVHGNPVNATDPSGLFQETYLALIVRNILQKANASPVVVYRSVQAANAVSRAFWVASRGAFRLSLNVIAERVRRERIPTVVHFGGNLEEHADHILDTQLGVGNTLSRVRGIDPRLYIERGSKLSFREVPLRHPIVIPGFFVPVRGTDPTPIERNALLASALPNRSGFARDEFPFASTTQGGLAQYNQDRVSVRYVDSAESNRQGGLLGAFYVGVNLTASSPWVNNPLFGRFGVIGSPFILRQSGYFNRQGEWIEVGG